MGEVPLATLQLSAGGCPLRDTPRQQGGKDHLRGDPRRGCRGLSRAVSPGCRGRGVELPTAGHSLGSSYRRADSSTAGLKHSTARRADSDRTHDRRAAAGLKPRRGTPSRVTHLQGFSEPYSDASRQHDARRAHTDMDREARRFSEPYSEKFNAPNFSVREHDIHDLTRATMFDTSTNAVDTVASMSRSWSAEQRKANANTTTRASRTSNECANRRPPRPVAVAAGVGRSPLDPVAPPLPVLRDIRSHL